MIFQALMFVLLILSMMLQEFMPRLEISVGGTIELLILLPWVVFYSLALTVPFPVMLSFALVLGFMWDARMQFPMETPDFAFGTSIVLFALLGSLMQGIRPLFRKGHWMLPVFMVGIAVFFQLVFQYLLINFQRGHFFISGEIWFKVVLTAGSAMVLAPFLLTFVSMIAKRCGYQLEFEKTMFRSVYGHQI